MRRSSIATCLCLVGPLVVAAGFIAYTSQLFDWSTAPGRPQVFTLPDDDLPPFDTSIDGVYNTAYSNGYNPGVPFNRSRYTINRFLERRKERLAKEEAIRNRKGSVNVYRSKTKILRKNCVPYKTWTPRSRLCVYDKRHGDLISSHIRDTGTWEPDLVGAMATTLSSVPDMHVIDIGCNVGAYTFPAALMGRRVLAIDPIRTNLFFLHSSLVYSGLSVRSNVTLLLNAISDKTEPVKVLVNNKNIGGSSIRDVVSTDLDDQRVDDTIVDAITLNDLVRVVDFRKVFVKIDIEGHEVNALRRSEKFFKHFDVRFIMMEWMLQRNSPNGRESIQILSRLGYLPFASFSSKDDPLNTEVYSSWPDDMVWIKKRTRDAM